MDNFNLIPKEAFESMANVANNLINKLSSATGYFFIPKGKKKDMEEAVSYFINEIKSNERMTALAKAASIGNARKLIREYCNQNDILCIAMNNLVETANPDAIDDDWLIDFWEKAKYINEEGVKLIFGKILAEACNDSEKRVSKSLIQKIYLMNKELAVSIQRLRKYTVKMDVYDIDGKKVYGGVEVLYYGNYLMWYKKYSTIGIDLFELDTLGILKIEDCDISFSNNDTLKPIKEICISYGNKSFSITGTKRSSFENLSLPVAIPCGTIGLTRDGKYLMSIIESDEYIETYCDDLKGFFDEQGYVIR